jgi:hypothetical protein
MPGVKDVINEQDDFAAHTLSITLWPKKWQGYANPHPLSWTLVKLEDAARKAKAVPPKAGIYTLLVQPGVAAHPHCSFLLYVGQTKSLLKRFGQYLTTEKKATGRPKIFRLLNRYDGYIWFCFSQVPENDLDLVEDSLIEAYVPHCNDDFPADLRPVVGAFK